MEKRTELILAWAEGRYALGWRGWLAEKILRPVLNEVLAEEKNHKLFSTHA